MDFYSVWPPLVILAAIFALAGTPLLRWADAPPIPTGNRVSTLDGLRGFLALSVFFHHAAIYHRLAQGRPWTPPPNRLYALLGPFGVAMFFMITGFLFWGLLIDKQGKPGLVKLYVGRVFRLGPLYLAAIITVTLVALGVSGFHFRESPARVAFEFVDWAAPLGFHMGPAINGYAQSSNLINVIWSLRYEWLFYISLAVTGLFTRNLTSAVAFPAATLILSLALMQFPFLRRATVEAPFIALFSIGMLTASVRTVAPTRAGPQPAASAFTAGLLLAVLFLFDTAYAVLPICLLGIAFFFISRGASLFGLLNTQAAVRLGNVSYGVYLLQLLVLAGAFALPTWRQFAVATPLGHWIVVAIAGFALVLIATLAHALVERPGIDMGRIATARLLGYRSFSQTRAKSDLGHKPGDLN